MPQLSSGRNDAGYTLMVGGFAETPTRTGASAEDVGEIDGKPLVRSVQYERILSASVDLFQEKGFHATSVREIGERAGVSQSGLYYHIRSKAQILIELNHRFMNRLTSALSQIVDTNESANIKLVAIVESFIAIIAAHQGEVATVLRERRSLPPEAVAAMQHERDSIDAMIDSVISQGIEEGTFIDVSVTLTRLALTGMVNWAYEWYRPSGPRDTEAIASAFSRLFLDGLTPRPSQ